MESMLATWSPSLKEIPTIIHVAASKLIDAGKLFRGTSMNSHHIITIPGALHALPNVLLIALFVPMRMKCWLTACGPLDALQFMPFATMKFTKEMP